MEIKDIIEYIEKTPCNSNPNVLETMLEELGSGVTPSGSLTITVNGTYDISDKASVVVNVGIVTLTVDGNGAIWESEVGEQYSFLHQTIAGSSVPEVDITAGWHDSEYSEVTILGYSSTKAKADAHEHDVTFPLTVTENRTIYLDWTE